MHKYPDINKSGFVVLEQKLFDVYLEHVKTQLKVNNKFYNIWSIKN